MMPVRTDRRPTHVAVSGRSRPAAPSIALCSRPSTPGRLRRWPSASVDRHCAQRMSSDAGRDEETALQAEQRNVTGTEGDRMSGACRRSLHCKLAAAAKGWPPPVIASPAEQGEAIQGHKQRPALVVCRKGSLHSCHPGLLRLRLAMTGGGRPCETISALPVSTVTSTTCPPPNTTQRRSCAPSASLPESPDRC
jgi:hypothetical protein